MLTKINFGKSTNTDFFQDFVFEIEGFFD